MREALTKLLYARYPILFAGHRLDASESGMAWGFQHEDGWFAIVDALAAVLTAHRPDAVAAQVKQKFGGLRFYLEEGDAFTRGACGAAEAFSQRVSEISGRPGVLMSREAQRWFRTVAPGEIAGYEPVRTSEGDVATDRQINGAGVSDDHGARAFHAMMALRLEPLSGACGPVDDLGRLLWLGPMGGAFTIDS